MSESEHIWETRDVIDNPLILDAMNVNQKKEERQYRLELSLFSSWQRSTFNKIAHPIDTSRRLSTFFL